jgi:hypothetical protein
MFARQVNDFETHTYAIPGTTLIFLQRFIENKTIQQNNSIFGISLSFFSIFFFFEEFIPSFYF